MDVGIERVVGDAAFLRARDGRNGDGDDISIGCPLYPERGDGSLYQKWSEIYHAGNSIRTHFQTTFEHLTGGFVAL